MGISIWQLVIVLVIVILLFGTKKLKNMGGDLGSAIKSFKKAVTDGDTASADNPSADKEADDKGTEKLTEQDAGRVIDGEVTSKESSSSSQNKDNA